MTHMPPIIKIFHVDAFSDVPFAGNPAAVCLLVSPRGAAWMQAVAKEMNLSETAFVLRRAGRIPGELYTLRWFTPTVEVDLCGHATLASAHVLWEEGCVKKSARIRFKTKSGVITAAKKEGWIEMDFPSEPERRVGAPDALVSALGVEPLYTGKNRFDYLVEVPSLKVLRAVRPDMRLLKGLSCRGVIVTCEGGSSGYDFFSRFFAPGAGIDEDHVTGSAYCCLGPFWAKRLGKKTLTAFQASKRGGVVRVRVCEKRVYISGKAVTIWKGELFC